MNTTLDLSLVVQPGDVLEAQVLVAEGGAAVFSIANKQENGTVLAMLCEQNMVSAPASLIARKSLHWVRCEGAAAAAFVTVKQWRKAERCSCG